MDLGKQIETRATNSALGVMDDGPDPTRSDMDEDMAGDPFAFLDAAVEDEHIPEASPEVEGVLASLAAEARRLHGQRANPVGDETSASLHVMPTPDQQMAEMRTSKERLAILALARHLLPHLLVAMADRDASGVAGAAICHAEAFTKKSKTYLESGIF